MCGVKGKTEVWPHEVQVSLSADVISSMTTIFFSIPLDLQRFWRDKGNLWKCKKKKVLQQQILLCSITDFWPNQWITHVYLRYYVARKYTTIAFMGLLNVRQRKTIKPNAE